MSKSTSGLHARHAPRRSYVRWHILQELFLLWHDSHTNVRRSMRGVVRYPELYRRVARRTDVPTPKTINCEIRWLIDENMIKVKYRNHRKTISNIYLTADGMELAWLAFYSVPTDYFRDHAESEYIAGKCRIRKPANRRTAR